MPTSERTTSSQEEYAVEEREIKAEETEAALDGDWRPLPTLTEEQEERQWLAYVAAMQKIMKRYEGEHA